MRTEHVDRRLADLHQACEHISANLVDLEIDSGRQLLDATRLEGESAARWETASQALTELWRAHGLLESLLKQADELRKSRRLDEVAALLRGRSIELTSSEVPIDRRKLLASAEETERCSPDELLASMSSAFDEVKTVLSQIGTAWSSSCPRSTPRAAGSTRQPSSRPSCTTATGPTSRPQDAGWTICEPRSRLIPCLSTRTRSTR